MDVSSQRQYAEGAGVRCTKAVLCDYTIQTPALESGVGGSDVAVELSVDYRRCRELALMLLLCGDMAELVVKREETSSRVSVYDDARGSSLSSPAVNGDSKLESGRHLSRYTAKPEGARSLQPFIKHGGG